MLRWTSGDKSLCLGPRPPRGPSLLSLHCVSEACGVATGRVAATSLQEKVCHHRIEAHVGLWTALGWSRRATSPRCRASGPLGPPVGVPLVRISCRHQKLWQPRL